MRIPFSLLIILVSFPAARAAEVAVSWRHAAAPVAITKLDLLCARTIGFPLRETSACAGLRLQTEELPGGAVGSQYATTVQVTGGIPFYEWKITAGSLPPGLKLDSFSGGISGAPIKPGVFEFTIRVPCGRSRLVCAIQRRIRLLRGAGAGWQ